MAEIINVREIATKIKEDLRGRIEKLRGEGAKEPTLATILVGDDPGSIYYMDMQKKVLEGLGGTMLSIKLPTDTAEEELLGTLRELNGDENVHGIMVLFPLPGHINQGRVQHGIAPEKDVDGVNPINIGLVASSPGGIAPCTPEAVLTILKEKVGNLTGLHAVVVGRSNIVGKPLLQLLLREHMTVTMCHSRTKDLPAVARTGEILIAAVGRPLMIDEAYVREGAVVIDVGTSELDGKITGDVDLSSVMEKAALVTKVPGGVGTLTTTILMRTLVEAWEAFVKR